MYRSVSIEGTHLWYKLMHFLSTGSPALVWEVQTFYDMEMGNFKKKTKREIA